MPDRYVAQRAAFPKGKWARAIRAFSHQEGDRILAHYPAGAWAKVEGHNDDGRAIFRFKDSGVVPFPYDDVRDVPMEVIEHPEQKRLDALSATGWDLFITLSRLKFAFGNRWSEDYLKDAERAIAHARRVLEVHNGTPESIATLPKSE